MATPHVCFADELQPAQRKTKKWLLELEPAGSPRTRSSSSLSISPTPRFERNLSFFQQLSRRFGLRSSDDLVEAAAVAAAAAATAAQEEDANSSSTDSYSARNRLELTSCASSETSSTIDIEEQQAEQSAEQQQQPQLKRKCSGFSRMQRRSTSSLRRAFESLTLTSRSLSCSVPSPAPAATATAAAPPTAPLPLKSALKSRSTVELRPQAQPATHRLASKCNSSSSCSSSSSNSSKAKPAPQRILRQPVSYTYLKGMSGLPTQRVPRSSVCCQYARR
ncbi:LOW QUALITY PROTEIN: mitochondrial fission regulator 2 [Drosophila busckii]|uniref:LOW QUALITY PROTEIN: mitochondrial fission regulator 2 n=1 Tax=Drosophila busckii TaxID=30019 RepID=UPI0014331C24|nr:LOW QUALITY PROTEIN: mitochondrial fission regulator 2 [Drosophila busckii]